MKRKSFKSILAMTVAISLFATLMSGCGSSSKDTTTSVSEVSAQDSTTSAQSAEKKAPVEIRYFDSNDSTTDVGKAYFAMIDKFQNKYKDEVKLTLEIVPNLDNLMSKVKMMFASGDNPELVALGGYDLVSVAQKADTVIDMKPYIDADSELKSWISPENLEFNTRDGKVLSLAAYKNAIGYFYNKELFQKANITPAKTWDEFFSNCDKLKAQGIVPMSMDTKDTAWVTNLLLGAMIGSSGDAGTKWMKTFHPTDYKTPEVIAALTNIQKCFKEYTPKNSIGGDYNSAENNFNSGKTAMIFNGNWMITDFTDKTKAPEGFVNKVGIAIYPNETAYLSSSTGYIVGKTTKEKEDAAMKFVKYILSPEAQTDFAMTMGYMPDNPTVSFTDDMKSKQALLISYIEQVNAARIRLQDYQSMWFPNVTDAFTTLYPQLGSGRITAEQLVDKLTELAQKNK